MSTYVTINKQGLSADFDEFYNNVDDPWGQSANENRNESRRLIAEKWAKELYNDGRISRACEVGCGFGHLTAKLANNSIDCIGTDISASAIGKAKELHNYNGFFEVEFNNWDFYVENKIDLYILSEITWYVLPYLDDFIDFLKKLSAKLEKPIYLIHLLSVYPPGVQKHGTEFFTDLNSILDYFCADYIESGIINRNISHTTTYHGTYFVGSFSG